MHLVRPTLGKASDLADLQSGVIARPQLIAVGHTANDLRRMLRRKELVSLHPGVYLTHTGDPTWLQRAWGAVLFAWPAALSHESALRAAEGPGSHRNIETIAIAVAHERRISAPPGVSIARTSHLHERVHWNLSPPRVRYAEAALDVAMCATSDWEALGSLSTACQSRRTTARTLLGSLDGRTRSPRRNWIGEVLLDIADGACSVLEHGYLTRVERAHGLPTAHRQQRSNAAFGVVYRDAAYGEVIVELDGRLFHDTASARDRDMDRDLDAATTGHTTVRLSYGQVFDRPCHTAQRLGTLLQHHGWDSGPHACGASCTLNGSVGVT